MGQKEYTEQEHVIVLLAWCSTTNVHAWPLACIYDYIYMNTQARVTVVIIISRDFGSRTIVVRYSLICSDLARFSLTKQVKWPVSHVL